MTTSDSDDSSRLARLQMRDSESPVSVLEAPKGSPMKSSLKQQKKSGERSVSTSSRKSRKPSTKKSKTVAFQQSPIRSPSTPPEPRRLPFSEPAFADELQHRATGLPRTASPSQLPLSQPSFADELRSRATGLPRSLSPERRMQRDPSFLVPSMHIRTFRTPKASKYDAALREKREARRTKERERQATVLDKKGSVYCERGRYDLAYRRWERALKMKRQNLKQHQQATPEKEEERKDLVASLATSIHNMTYLKQRSGQATADETMAAYIKSLQMKRETLGRNHMSVGKALNNIGSVLYVKKEYMAAIRVYREALRILRKNLGPDHLNLGTVHSNIGDALLAAGKRSRAMEEYLRALEIRWEKVPSSDARIQRLLEQITILEEEGSDSEYDDFYEEDYRRGMLREASSGDDSSTFLQL